MTNPNPVPPLEAEQLAALEADIARRGVLVPVLKDRDGNVVDGFNRIAITTKLGIDYPVYVMGHDPEETPELRIVVNALRRHMTTESWYALIQKITSPHIKAVWAETANISGNGQERQGIRLGEVERRVNAELKAMGVNKSVKGSTAVTIARHGTANPSYERRRARSSSTTTRSSSKGTVKKQLSSSKRDPRVVASEESMLKIRQSNAQDQYQSMLNAPRAKLNLPLIRVAEQVQPLLVELTGVDPEVAITQIPIERCRQWQPEQARWWLRFTELCAERLAREAPDLPPVRYPTRTKLVMKTDTPTEEYQLAPLQASVLGWLQQQSQPRFILEIAAGILAQRTSVLGALRRLEELGFVRVTGTHARSQMFEVAPKEHGE